MLALEYFKGQPTEYIRFSRGGKVRSRGAGISGLYFPGLTTIEVISIASNTTPFVFNQVTKDHQEVQVQGGLIYQTTDPEKPLNLYTHTINPKTRAYLTDAPEQLANRLVKAAELGSQKITQGTKLELLLPDASNVAASIQEGLSAAEMSALGVTVSSVYITKIAPKPEIARALEATLREELLKKADAATYERRMHTVLREDEIAQRTLQNQIAQEQKRTEFVRLEGENAIAAAEYRRRALEQELGPFRDIAPDLLRSLGLYRIGEKAENIGTLNVVPELYGAIAGARPNA